MRRQQYRKRRAPTFLAVIAGALVAACDSPTGPEGRAAAIVIGDVTTTATFARPEGLRFLYGMPLVLRETGGVGATITEVTATLTEVSGASTTARLSPADVFGTARITARGTLASTTIALAATPSTASEMSVRVAFNDDRGNAGSVQASSVVRLDLNGNWSGPLRFPTNPRADLSLGRVTIVQSGNSLTGELVSRDGIRFPLSGRVDALRPSLQVNGLTSCGIVMLVEEFQFGGGHTRRMSGRAGGRCPGTVDGTFELERGS